MFNDSLRWDLPSLDFILFWYKLRLSFFLLALLGSCCCGGRSADKVGHVEGDDHREFDIAAKDALLEPGGLVDHLLDAKLLDGVNVFLVSLEKFTELNEIGK